MRAIIVCGGRNYTDSYRVFTALNVERPDHVIHGCAPGADRLASEWCDRSSTSHEVFRANWSIGRKAGPQRNERMLRALLQWASQGYDIAVIAFPGGRGTADMVRRARAADVRVIEVPA